MLDSKEISDICCKAKTLLAPYAAERNPDWWGIYHVTLNTGEWVGEDDWRRVFDALPFWAEYAYMTAANGVSCREVARIYNEGGYPALGNAASEVIDEDDGTGCYYTEVVCVRCGAGWTCECDCC